MRFICNGWKPFIAYRFVLTATSVTLPSAAVSRLVMIPALFITVATSQSRNSDENCFSSFISVGKPSEKRGYFFQTSVL